MDTPYELFADPAAEASPPERGILSQTLARHATFELVLFAMAAGEQLSEHTAAQPVIVHVLDGEAELTVAGDSHSLSRGTWLYMQPRTAHSIVAGTPLVFALYLLNMDEGAS